MTASTMKASEMRAPKENGTLILKRTFNQDDFKGSYIKFWRVVGPANHPSLNSDISLEWLKEKGYILWF